MQRRAAPIVFIAGLASAAMLNAQSAAPRGRAPAVLPIASIAVTGNKTLSTGAIIAASGLKVNENGGPAIFDAARERLLDTGYFDAVGYTFRQQDSGFAIVFRIAEMKQVFPLHAEALPITSDQVTKLLRAGDPLFNGLLPGTKQVIDRAASMVEQYLAPANPGLRVRAKVIPDGDDRYEILLAPAEGLPVIADVTFEGSKVIKDIDLHTVMIENGIGQVFSEAGIRALLDRFIRPLYEKQGYMRVSFPKIVSKPAADVKGIDVHVTVDDGPRFRLGAVSVRGPVVERREAGDPGRILRIAGLARGGFVNGGEILQATARIYDTLRSEGYLDVTVSTGRSIDDADKTIGVWFDVNPGVLYRFGHLEVLGLGLEGEAAIRKMWTVKPGDPFPGRYPGYFAQAVKDEGLFDNLGGIVATPSVNRQTRIVDVSLSFSGAPSSAERRRSPY